MLLLQLPSQILMDATVFPALMEEHVRILLEVITAHAHLIILASIAKVFVTTLDLECFVDRCCGSVVRRRM